MLSSLFQWKGEPAEAKARTEGQGGGVLIADAGANLLAPYRLYQGTNTNFCGYAALSWLPLHDDPLMYVRFLMTLYTDGHATWGAIQFNPMTLFDPGPLNNPVIRSVHDLREIIIGPNFFRKILAYA